MEWSHDVTKGKRIGCLCVYSTPAHGPSFTCSAFDSTLVQHRNEPGLYLLALLLPQNICFPRAILDGTALHFEFEVLASDLFFLSTRAPVRQIIEPWSLELTSTHTIEVGNG